MTNRGVDIDKLKTLSSDPNDEIILKFEIGILKSIHAKKLLTDEQVKKCIDTLIEKHKTKGTSI